MIITEDQIRALIYEKLKEARQKSVVADLSPDSSDSSDESSYEGPLVSVANGKKYLGDPSIGMSPPGYWKEFRSKLNAHINKVYPELGFKIDNLGVSRDLGAAADAGGNTARVSGSKHGAGLAQDIYMHTKKYGKYTSYKKDNPKLAKDQKLVDAIISFLETSSYSGKVFWGGAFSSNKRSLKKGQAPKDRGILEFHHFEFADEDMPNYFTKYKDELEKLGINSGQITSTKALGNLYNKLLGKGINEERQKSVTANLSQSSSDASSDGSGAIHVSDPVKIVGGSYPEKNVRAVESAMEKEGITNKFLKVAILSVIAKESNMKPKNEKPYSNTSNSRIRKIFGNRVPKDDASLNALKADPKAFFDKIYGGRYGNAPDEGYKYRGRGFNQITFKGTYKKMGELIGVDLVSNPDKLNDVSVAARVAVAFLLKRLKRHASNYNDVTSQDKANIMTARANAGWGKVPGVSSSVDRAISNTKERNAHFSYESSSKIA